MSNKNDDDDDKRGQDDALEGERLYDADHLKHSKSAQQDSFTSFSEGLATIDKFQILGADESPSVRSTRNFHNQNAIKGDTTPLKSRPKKSQDDSFTSFSQGLPSAQQFTIMDDERRIDSGHLFVLSDFLEKTDCAFLKNYDRKRGPSKTLDRLMHLLRTVPWKRELLVEVRFNPGAREFDFEHDTIVLDSQASDEEMLLDFSHQCYHATNRLLTKLYDGEILDKYTYIDLLIWAEVAALITELNVRRDFGITKVIPSVVLCQESGGTSGSINVEEFMKKKGMKALHDRLIYSHVRGSTDLTLVGVLTELYDDYRETYDEYAGEIQAVVDRCLQLGLERDCI